MARPDDSELVRELKEIDRCIQCHRDDANVRGVYPSGVWLQHWGDKRREVADKINCLWAAKTEDQPE